MACRLAGQRITSDEIQKLKDLFVPFLGDSKTINFREYQKADQEFHRLLLQYSGNSMLPKMVLIGNVFIMAYQNGLVRYPAETLPEHLDMIDALARKDGKGAEKLMKRHLHISVGLIERAFSDNQ